MRSFLTALSVITLLLFTALKSDAQIIYNENFNYPEGDSLGAHGWTSFSGGATNVLSVTSPGLTFSGYPPSNIGRATTVRTSGQDAYTPLNAIDSSGSFYVSAMINVTSAQAGDYFLAFLPSTSTTFYSGRLHARLSGTDLQFGITKAAGGDTTVAGIWTTTPFALNTTYLVVMKYTYVSGSSNDQVSLYVFSSAPPSTEPTPSVGPVTFSSGDAFNIGRLALRQGTSTRAPVAIVDGIRVTRSWSSILTSVVNQTSEIPTGFMLTQNYPNPFNPSTTISFSIPSKGHAALTVYDFLGREVSSLYDGGISAGSYNAVFNALGLSSGAYLYRLEFTDEKGSSISESRKLIIAK